MTNPIAARLFQRRVFSHEHSTGNDPQKAHVKHLANVDISGFTEYRSLFLWLPGQLDGRAANIYQAFDSARTDDQLVFNAESGCNQTP
jgi:hypothetical protein